MIPSALSKVISESPNFNTIIVSTGNILNNEIGRKSNEELYDGLQLALEYGTPENDEATGDRVELFESEGKILRATAELKQKITENERPAISIGAKLFLNKITPNYSVEQAIQSTLQILNVENLDNLVVAYHPNAQTSETPTATAATETPTKTPCAESTAGGGGGGSAFSWSARNPGTAIADLKILYTSLEDFALQKQVLQLGVADLDAETLKQLCVSARVPPTIAQINLTACCVVPQELKDFCNANDIQLLTHGDPEMLLSDEDFQKALPGYELDWALRYQVHVRCRGLLSAKGYIIGATKILQDNNPSETSVTSYKSA